MAKSTKKRGTPVNIALDATKQKQFNQKVHTVRQKGAKVGGDESGVVYLSRLPWGFDEHPMRDYFRQFGKIKQLRVSRSKKTGNSRGYAYIQFQHDEVAKIVAETMNNYLMFGKLIKCRHLTNPHPDTFKNASKKFFQPGLETRKAIEKHNSHKSDEAVEKSQKKMLAKYTKLQAKLAASGINYKLNDKMLEKCRAEIKEKSATKLAELKKNKPETDKGDDDSDDDDDDESDDDSDSNEDDTEVPKFSLMGSKADKTKTPIKISQSVPTTPKSAKIQKKASQSTGKPKGRQSMISNEVDTPKGKKNVLKEDSEVEIAVKTPPLSNKSSKLEKTPETLTPEPKKVSPKRKHEEATPKSSAKKAKVSAEEPVIPSRMTLRTPKTATPKTPRTVVPKTPKSAAPKTPKTAALKTPRAEALKTPKAAAPKTPIAAAPKTPIAATPKTPKTVAQKTPKAEALKTPKTAAQKTPKAGTLKTPKAGDEQSEGSMTPKSAGKPGSGRKTKSGRRVRTPKR